MTDSVDFDSLVEQAKVSGDVRDIWRAVYQLEELWFLPSPTSEEPSPFIGVIEGQNWVFAYTDPAHLAKSASSVLGEGANETGIKMSMDSAIPWLDSIRASGVFGVRVNDGDNGFFAPLSNIIPMRDFYAQE